MSLTIVPRTTTVLLLQGDDLDPINDRSYAVTRAVNTSAPTRLNDTDTPISESITDYDAFMEEAVERAVKVKLTALPRKAYRLLLNDHPVRMVAGEEGETVHPEDDGWGFNRDTFGDAIVPVSIDADQFDNDADRDAFLDSLSDADFNKLYSAAVSLNQSPGPDPKARLSSHLALMSDETSTSPERLG